MSEELHPYFPGKPGDPRERIIDLLKERHMTQAELAEKIGISDGTLNRYLEGKTQKISAQQIAAIADVFKVPTDFLLCLSDIPYKTAYDIARLGLSANAAKNLLERKVDPSIVSQLIENEHFALLVRQLAQLCDEGYAAQYITMTEELQASRQLFAKHAKYNPEDCPAAKMAGTEINTFRTEPYRAMTETILKTMEKIVNDFREKSIEKQTDTDAQVLTSKIMAGLTAGLDKQLSSKKSLLKISPEDFISAMNIPLDLTNLNEEEKKKFLGLLLKMFERPQEQGSNDT